MASRDSEFEDVADRLHTVNAEFRVGRLQNYTDHNDSEKVVRTYFEDMGYNVHKLRGADIRTKSYLEEYFTFFNDMDIGEAGMPDFFVDKMYHKLNPGKTTKSKTVTEKSIKGDYRFVEVKSDNGGLRMNQLKWIGQHPHIPIEVIVVE